MRHLHARIHRRGQSAIGEKAETDRGRRAPLARRQFVPLYGIRQNRPSCDRCRSAGGREVESMKRASSRTPGVFAAIHLCVHVAFVALLLIVLLVITPRAEYRMKAYNLQLPSLTLLLMRISSWIGGLSYLIGCAALPVFGIDWLLLFLPRKATLTRRLSTLWAVTSLA